MNQFCGYANYSRRCRFRYRGRRFYYLRRRTNKVRKSRGCYSDTEEGEERKKTFRPARGFGKKGKNSTRVFARSRAATSTDAMRNWIEIILLSFRTFGFRPSANNGDADVRATGGGANLLFKFSFLHSRPTNFRSCRRINGFPV